MAIENAAVLKLVARLVMDYLDEQNLSEALNTFCETSRHLSDQEYEAYSQGIKSLDIGGIGLINIVKEYFLIKDKLRDFIKSCPKTSIIISLIDTTNLQSRLELVLKALKENLLKIDKVQEDVSRKRRKTDNEPFEISQTNTSTPETVHPLKKRRISCSKPINSANNSNSEKNKEIPYISSPETSNKEDDVTDDESKIKPSTSNTKINPPPELLSETILKKPDFAGDLAEIINKTLKRAENEESEEATSKLTDHHVQDILSKTLNSKENDFEDILKEVIDKYLIDGSESAKVNDDSLNTTPTDIKEAKNEENTCYKQKLRPRTAKKLPLTERKKKINIISNELYTGPLPLCVPMSSTSSIVSQNNLTTTVNSVETHTSQSLILVPIMQPLSTTTATFIPLHSFHPGSNIVCENNIPITSSTELSSNVQIILTENNPTLPNLIHENNSTLSNFVQENIPSDNVQASNTEEINNHVEKVQKTPKMTMQTNFLESKCKSTPRRKATHVRILDFNHTPSGRLAAIKECKTPSNSIRVDTPGSAPASIMVSQKIKIDNETTKASQNIENGEKSIEIVDESSNSNSISNTPKVAKNRRRRKIEIDSKLDKTTEEISPKPMTREDWIKMREEQKNLSVDERMRILFQQNEEKNNTKKRKTPKKKKQEAKKVAESKIVKKLKPTSVQTGKAKLCAKFKVTSPRKSALLRKTPKKKKIPTVIFSEKAIVSTNDEKISSEILKEVPKNDLKENEENKNLNCNLPTLNSNNVSLEKDENDGVDEHTDLNRSDTIQEVANLLTHLPETILAKTNSGNNFDASAQKQAMIDPAILMETPLKIESISPLPNTPRFAVPLISTHQETPLSKEIVTVTTAPSILKVCDILTPSFPITPGFKVTPAKSEASPSGYSSRRTDYSSCSSYYKPDESEDINQNFDTLIKQRNSLSESDGANQMTVLVETKVRTGSTKKVECPGALERVLSFTEETNAIIIPHYNMNEEGLLSESMITTGSDDSSSSFTCSTCSTDPSSDENTIQKLSKVDTNDDRDSEWHCEEEIDITSNTSLVDEKTGEVRFPLRNWITPKKVDPQEQSKTLFEEMKAEKVKTAEEIKEEEQKQMKANLEAVKQRTLKIIKKETETNSKRFQPKFKKSNVKQFKLPAEQPKQIPLTRKDQILQHNLTERPKSTPLKLLPSTSSSSRRKCLTPRKTIIMDELPKADPIIKKSNKKRQSTDKGKCDSVKIIKSPAKPEKVSLENINDNAMMHDDHPSLNISTSLNDSTDDDEPENTVVNKMPVKSNDEGSNTFQRTLIAQGFDKTEAKDLQIKFVDKIEEEQQKLAATDVKESQKQIEIKDTIDVGHKELNLSVPDSESETEEIEDECEFRFADSLEKNVFSFEEPQNFVAKKEIPKNGKLCAPSKLQIDGKSVKIDFSDVMDIFTMEPTTKQKDDKNLKKEHTKDIVLKTSEPKILTKEISIDKILTMIHGNH